MREEFESILRFWLDRGVDGFRIDVAHGLIKDKDLPDRVTAAASTWRRTGTSLRSTRSIGGGTSLLAAYDGDRMAVAEAWADDEEKMARYVRRDEFQQAFNFHWLEAPWSARGLPAGHRAHVRRRRTCPGVADVGPVQPRRGARGDAVRRRGRRGSRGRRRRRWRCSRCRGRRTSTRAQELGLPQADVPEQGPAGPRVVSRGGGLGRDGCRVPMPMVGQRAAVRLRPGRRSTPLAAAAGVVARTQPSRRRTRTRRRL